MLWIITIKIVYSTPKACNWASISILMLRNITVVWLNMICVNPPWSPVFIKQGIDVVCTSRFYPQRQRRGFVKDIIIHPSILTDTKAATPWVHVDECQMWGLMISCPILESFWMSLGWISLKDFKIQQYCVESWWSLVAFIPTINWRILKMFLNIGKVHIELADVLFNVFQPKVCLVFIFLLVGHL